MIALAVAALFTMSDLVGDATGDGTLTAPSSARLGDVATFDLHEVTILDENNLTLTITMGSLDNPSGLVNGFSNPIIEIYVDSDDGGATGLLPGSGMALPPGAGWETALRITGDEASGFRSDPTGETQATVRFPLEVVAEGRTLTVATPFAAPEQPALYVIVGVYDPFSDDGWRPLGRSPTPWAFSSEQQQKPVVDLLATTAEAQRDAIDSGFLPSMAQPRQGAPWLLLMGFGVAVALLGLAMRGLLGRAPATPGDAAGETGAGSAAAPAPETTGAPDDTRPTTATISRNTPPLLVPTLDAAVSADFGSAEPANSWLQEELEAPEVAENWPFVAGWEDESS